jgi:hypothetical protein
MSPNRASIVTFSALAASALLNAVLAWLLAHGGSPLANAPPPASRPGVAGDAKPAAATADTDDAAEYRHWLSLGLTEHEAVQLLLARLEAAAAAGPDAHAASYWRPAAAAERGAVLAARLDAENAIRARLEAVLGPSAGTLTELTSVYRPLDPELALLSSDEQLAVRRLRLERLAQQTAEPRMGAARGPDARATRDDSTELDALRAVLPEDLALEVALRDSPLAAQLRGSGVDFSEREFRAAFELLGDAATASDPKGRLESRAALARLLGPRRFNRLWSQRDPLAAVVRRVGADLGLSDAAIEQGYAVLNDAQGRLLEAALQGGEPQRLASAAQEIASAERRDLEIALGAEAADSLLAARSDFLAAAARTTPPGPQQ